MSYGILKVMTVYKRAFACAMGVLLAATFAGCTTHVDAPSPKEPAFAAELKPLLSERMKELSVPGAIVLVDVPGQGEWVTALGMGDLQSEEPMDADDHVRIASITKSMTASIILQLVDEGELSLDDPVSTFVPMVPNGANITVRQLLSMTSGLADYFGNEDFMIRADADLTREWTNEELLNYAFEMPPLFAPGQDYDYSNTNYVLLGMIIQQLTGADLPSVYKERLFDKLGMQDTAYPPLTDTSIAAPHANGYDFVTFQSLARAQEAAEAGDTQNAQVAARPGATPRDVTDLNPSLAMAAGAATSSAADLKTWIKEVATGTLLTPESQQQRFDFQGRNYGLGVDKIAPGAVGHNGEILGFQSFAAFYPETQATVIVLTNLSSAPNVPLSERLPADQLAEVIHDQLFS